jgi:hypothetical protein
MASIETKTPNCPSGPRFHLRRAPLIAYATVIWFFGWWPWNVMLLALVAARSTTVNQKRSQCMFLRWLMMNVC